MQSNLHHVSSTTSECNDRIWSILYDCCFGEKWALGKLPYCFLTIQNKSLIKQQQQQQNKNIINNKNISYTREILELLELIKQWEIEPESPKDLALCYNLLEIFNLIWVVYLNSDPSLWQSKR